MRCRRRERHGGSGSGPARRPPPALPSLPARRTPAVARALDEIARDTAARTRFLEFARASDPPEVRVRLVNLARDLGWLSPEERWSELALMLGDLQGRIQVGVAEVGLACNLNQEGDLNGAFNRRTRPTAKRSSPG